MSMIIWEKSHSVGEEEIDEQHRDFVKLINRLQIMHDRGTPRDLTLRILLEVVKYTEYHFTSEENLMIIAKCPLLERQQKEHRALLEALNEKYKAFEAGDETIKPIIDFLVGWFLSHSSDLDRRAGQFISEYARGQAAGEAGR